MTLTDREIAILHLALCGAYGAGGMSDCRFDAEVRTWASLPEGDSHIERALAMAPLYRHAFGIEAPGEDEKAFEEYTEEEILAGLNMSEFLLGNIVEVAAYPSSVNQQMPEPSPASLAIANALSKTRP